MRSALSPVFTSILLASLYLAAPAAAQSGSYQDLQPVSGDVHQHAMAAHGAPAVDNTYPHRCDGPHQWGSPIGLYQVMRDAGYDWVNLSHHDHLMTDSEDDQGYRWWIDPNSEPVGGLNGTTVEPDPEDFPGDPYGFPDYTTGEAIQVPGIDPWNEAYSFSTAANAADAPGSFAAFSGREYTSTSPNPGYCDGSSAGFGCAGHKDVILPRDTTRVCSSNVNAFTNPDDCTGYELYLWTLAYDGDPWDPENAGAIVQAHPNGGNGPDPDAYTPLHPLNAPSGFSDSFVHGFELATSVSYGNSRANGWDAFHAALRAGYRIFPAFGGDAHNRRENCDASTSGLTPNRGGTLCWIDPGQDFNRPGITAAMRNRHCYYGRANKPVLELEVRDEPTDSFAIMGDEISSTDGIVHVRFRATNDPVNKGRSCSTDGVCDMRFDAMELRHVGAAGMQILATCDSTTGESCNCERIDEGPDEGLDTCFFEDSALPVAPGALYVRVRREEGCTPPKEGGDCQTVAVSAPVFINWDQHRAARNVRHCNFDADTIPCILPDSCPSGSNPDAAEDNDGFPSTCDTCPSISDPDQTDTDGNGRGDLCNDTFDDDGDEYENEWDNCPDDANPDQADTDGSGIGDACNDAFDADGDEYEDGIDTCPDDYNPNQNLDRDGDGTMDECDNCPDLANPAQADLDDNGVGDACNLYEDADGDDFGTDEDVCPFVYDPDQIDSDEDGLGDACDNCPEGLPDPCTFTDSDSDGWGDAIDNCDGTQNFNQSDTDRDGIGNACETDSDNDGVDDSNDNCRLTPNGPALGSCLAGDPTLLGVPCQSDAECGAAGLCEMDQLNSDTDSFGDVCDNCSEYDNETQHDSNLDGYGNACDCDFDDDGDCGFWDETFFDNAWGADSAIGVFDYDMNGDGAIETSDFILLSIAWPTPGPSGLGCAGTENCAPLEQLIDEQGRYTFDVRIRFNGAQGIVLPSVGAAPQVEVGGSMVWWGPGKLACNFWCDCPEGASCGGANWYHTNIPKNPPDRARMTPWAFTCNAKYATGDLEYEPYAFCYDDRGQSHRTTIETDPVPTATGSVDTSPTPGPFTLTCGADDGAGELKELRIYDETLAMIAQKTTEPVSSDSFTHVVEEAAVPAPGEHFYLCGGVDEYNQFGYTVITVEVTAP